MLSFSLRLCVCVCCKESSNTGGKDFFLEIPTGVRSRSQIFEMWPTALNRSGLKKKKSTAASVLIVSYISVQLRYSDVDVCV